jgi:hypothetical protein
MEFLCLKSNTLGPAGLDLVPVSTTGDLLSLHLG